MISIEIPVLHGKYLRDVFESIRSQSFQDYEVIIVNSGPPLISDLIKEYGFKEVEGKNSKLLHARYQAHLESHGDFSLILDETRYLEKNALLKLSSLKSDMTIIHETEVAEGGKSIWVKGAQLDKDNIIYCNSVESIKGFALPRYFNSKILSKSFTSLLNNLGEKFYDVVFPDHELIYYEASKISSDVNIVKDPLIYHYGDSSLFEILRKYYRYGKTINVLRGTKYNNFLSIKRKKRNICKGTIKDKLILYILYLSRGIPFILGKYL
ncbi:glycosyltransferase family 2 protein [Metallosphaera javensis (ex Sakai et al. 2022)]|uniref:glycosyltransferase family A protein n=1 Tax=Metallosphaera javensis (ex Sakai et al. 2022) TaxID=2775498 RepID=UPI00258ED4EA